MAADVLGVRMAHLEGAYEQIDKRLGSLEVRFGSLEGEVRDLRGEVRTLRTELIVRMDRQFFWILGLLIISIVSPLAGRVIGR